jgi:hypothetical protein
MKRTMIRTLVTLSLSAVLSPVALMAQGPINATIPFDFTVGTKSFAAGEYSVRQVNPAVLLIRNVKDSSGIMALTTPADAVKKGTPVLTFTRYGDSYFLSGVASENQGWKLHQSRAEKEMIAKVSSPAPVSITASLRSK